MLDTERRLSHRLAVSGRRSKCASQHFQVRLAPPHLGGILITSDQCNSQNLTLRFFKDSTESSCGYSNTSDALTFTTSSIPVIGACFEFADLFGGNSSQGFINQTQNLGGLQQSNAGIAWQLLNKDAYDPQGNYSGILYRQHVLNDDGEDKYKPGHFAERLVTLYGGKNCTEVDSSSNETLVDWYGFSCWSESEGRCGTLPYSIVSFHVTPEADFADKDGTCWDFAQLGAAAGLRRSVGTALASFLMASIMVEILV